MDEDEFGYGIPKGDLPVWKPEPPRFNWWLFWIWLIGIIVLYTLFFGGF